MAEQEYIYNIDDRPPAKLGLVYGLQWAVIMFPALIIAATLAARALSLDAAQEVRFMQLTILTSGLFSAIQTAWGHRFPLLEGPATALLLTYIVIAPYGIGTLQGGMILGGVLLIAIVLSGQLNRIIRFITPNVVGVVLMLIAFTLLPHLINSMSGVDSAHPDGEISIFLISLFLVILMAAFSHWLTRFWKTISLLLGIVVGTLVFGFKGLVDWQSVSTAAWITLPGRLIPSWPHFYWPAVVAFASAYLAVIVNSLGSIHGIANVTDTERLPSAVPRGILVNGVGGVFCGLLGIVGTVSYSISPGVVLANRVASRYTIMYCGFILIAAALAPKMAALLALVPAPVVGAALTVAMGAQIGAGLSIISRDGFTGRDYFVVGLPLLLGTMVGFLPEALVASVPPAFQIFLGNGLIVGIFLVLLMEHVFLRKREG